MEAHKQRVVILIWESSVILTVWENSLKKQELQIFKTSMVRANCSKKCPKIMMAALRKMTLSTLSWIQSHLLLREQRSQTFLLYSWLANMLLLQKAVMPTALTLKTCNVVIELILHTTIRLREELRICLKNSMSSLPKRSQLEMSKMTLSSKSKTVRLSLKYPFLS